MRIICKRIYEGSDEADGIRILVDRLWPRGVSKEKANLDYWLKDVAPSDELRIWFHHEEGKFPEFRTRYVDELKLGIQKEVFDEIRKIVSTSKSTVTLLYGAKNEKFNQAVVLKELLEKEE